MGNFVSDRNEATFQNNGNDIQPQEKVIVVNDKSLVSLEDGPQSTSSSSSSLPTSPVLTTNINGINRYDNIDDKLSPEALSKEEEQNGLNDHCCKNYGSESESSIELFETTVKSIYAPVNGRFRKTMMVNSTAQHPKTRNPTNSTVATNSHSNSTSNNSVTSTRDANAIKEHIEDESMMIMSTKSPLSAASSVIEVISLLIIIFI